MQGDIAATVQMELARFFTAKAEAKESAPWQEANGADDAMGLDAFRIDIVKFDDKFVGVVHGALKQGVHIFLAESESVVLLRELESATPVLQVLD